MNEELIKQAYQLGYWAGLEKSGAIVRPLGAKELIDIAMSPKLEKMVAKFKRPAVGASSFVAPTKRLTDALGAVNEAVHILRKDNPGLLSRFIGVFRRGSASRDARFFRELDQERLRHRMHQLFDAEDFDRVVQAQRKTNVPVIRQNLDRLQLLRDAAKDSGVFPVQLSSDLPYMERQRLVGKFLDSLNNQTTRKQHSTGFLHYLDRGITDRVFPEHRPTSLDIIKDYGK